jgi:exo-beta-1,3-glucanase (GH17 family)
MSRYDFPCSSYSLLRQVSLCTTLQLIEQLLTKSQPGTPVWITETGWPVTGDSFGAADASASNALGYWKGVACSALQQIDIWWYAYQDYNANPSFGILDGQNRPIYNLTC